MLIEFAPTNLYQIDHLELIKVCLVQIFQDNKCSTLWRRQLTAEKVLQFRSQGTNVVNIGVDLSEFYMSVEWDILAVPAIRNVKFYTCCDEPYLDITFNITMRRKTLFYTVNLIIPCMGISFLTVLVFYLPSDSGEKVSRPPAVLWSVNLIENVVNT